MNKPEITKKQFYEEIFNFCKAEFKKNYKSGFDELPKEVLGLNDITDKLIIINKNYINKTEQTKHILIHEICHILLLNHTMIFHIVAKQRSLSQYDKGIQTTTPLFPKFLKEIQEKWDISHLTDWIADNFKQDETL